MVAIILFLVIAKPDTALQDTNGGTLCSTSSFCNVRQQATPISSPSVTFALKFHREPSSVTFALKFHREPSSVTFARSVSVVSAPSRALLPIVLGIRITSGEETRILEKHDISFACYFSFFLYLFNNVPLHSLKYNSQRLNRRNRE